MPYRYTCVGYVLVYERSYLWKVAYAVVYEIYLTIARHLEVDGIGYYLVAIDTQFGLHGISVRWRCAYDAHIAGTHK